jgi:glycosyltransferase involved in cell wall biosynthesis
MSRPVAIVCGAGYVSGKEIMALELAEGLQASGRRVICITSSWSNGDFLERLRSSAIPFRRMRLGFISATLKCDAMAMTLIQFWRWPGLIFDYWRFLYKAKPARVIHTNWHHLLLLWMFLNQQRDWFWVHEFIPSKLQYRKVFGWLSHRLNGFVAVSDAIAESLRHLGIPEDKIRVIHNGLRNPAVDVALPATRLAKKNIGIVGQIGPWKGHEDLLEAFNIISQRHPSALLHVFGATGGRFGDSLKKRATEMGVSERVIWHGFVRSKNEIYPVLDICVIPSRFEEPFGMTAVEAAYFSVPVIATRRGGLPEIVQDGLTGFLVESESPMQLAQRLEDLIGNESLREKMGFAARQHVSSYFTRDRLVNEFDQLLRIAI